MASGSRLDRTTVAGQLALVGATQPCPGQWPAPTGRGLVPLLRACRARMTIRWALPRLVDVALTPPLILLTAPVYALEPCHRVAMMARPQK